jgi:hypothetical protein
MKPLALGQIWPCGPATRGNWPTLPGTTVIKPTWHTVACVPDNHGNVTVPVHGARHPLEARAVWGRTSAHNALARRQPWRGRWRASGGPKQSLSSRRGSRRCEAPVGHGEPDDNAPKQSNNVEGTTQWWSEAMRQLLALIKHRFYVPTCRVNV